MRCREDDFVMGGYYHVYNRSVDEVVLYKEPEDFEYYMEKVRKYSKNKARICCWCLMSNHFHFLVQQLGEFAVSKVFNSLNLSYVNHYNKKYDRKGKLYSDRLQHKRIERSDYMLKLCLYIHLNPVKDGFVDKAEEWKYSDYKDWIFGEECVRDELFHLTKEEYRELVENEAIKYTEKQLSKY